MVESDVKEVRRIRRATLGEVLLNLRGLDVPAQSGIRELRAWLDDGARLEKANPFLRMLLNMGLKETIPGLRGKPKPGVAHGTPASRTEKRRSKWVGNPENTE